MARTETTAPTEASDTDAPHRGRVVTFHWNTAELPDEPSARFGIAGEVSAAVYAVVALWQVGPLAACDVGKISFQLLANALQHGAAPVDLVVDQGFTGAVNIAVSDASDEMPTLLDRDLNTRVCSGGLSIVDEYAQTWDVYAHRDGGKTVHAVVVPSLVSGRASTTTRTASRRTRGSRDVSSSHSDRGERK